MAYGRDFCFFVTFINRICPGMLTIERIGYLID